ncbi:MAG: SpoVR family protein [Candidatus Schekmanbacteria bacterium RBG_16_38_10]|uniref:SpoVR family protein n=1 Tax=Candidatus Schekmanbacteria bacterium RBG_16_38_10 TaxID=1817879 RepID=A0A1F7RNI4_9BACT|nr:MAG: SpoVR family protein [Candidatus Schekmanbacteria bacterium RBG_16_38_10]
MPKDNTVKRKRRSTKLDNIFNIQIILSEIQEEIVSYVRDYGLDPFNTVFELITHDEMNEVASYGGFPSRYPHWRFGMEFEELSKSYKYGLQKIYELVINNDPCYAYLMKSNALTDQKMVIAHVYGHSDFFKNNLWFSQTNRKMIDEIANHGTRIRKYVEKYGEEKVEDFLDKALSIENLIDYHAIYSPYRKRAYYDIDAPEEDEAKVVRRFKSKDYMDKFINPPEYMKEQKKKIDDEKEKRKRFPEEPQKDILLFLIEEAQIENWQKDILAIIREEAYYFAPQALTKIMNEGWATYWHSKIMTEKCLEDNNVVDYADHHSGTLGSNPGTINPYKLGVELYRDIEDRWNKGKFGREYDECTDMNEKADWDKGLGLGREKIFEVRRVCNDITFIDDYLTDEFCDEHKLFVYKYNSQTNQYEITDRDFDEVKRQLLFRLTNMGHPIIYVVDGNYRNRSELLLKHQHEGADLQLDEAQDTLKNIYNVWQRPVNLETLLDDERKLLTYDGSKHSEEVMGETA